MMREYVQVIAREARYRVRGFFKRVNYVLQFMFYSFMVGFVSALLMYIVENRSGELNISFIDSLFLGFSAYTCSGLNTVDFTEFSAATITTLFVTVQLGSCVLLSTIPSVMKVRSFRKNKKRLTFFMEQAVTNRERSRHRKMIEHLERRITICAVLICSCCFYWFFVQMAFILFVSIWKPFYWATFHVGSAFNNAGFALSPSNMKPIAGDPQLLILFSLVMPLGNTLFPVFFRMFLSLLYRVLHAFVSSKRKFFGWSVFEWCGAVETLLIDPRSYYTHMFNAKDTLFLLMFWSTLTIIEFLMFIPEYDTPAFPKEYTLIHKISMAVFQTVTVRSTGFSVLDLTLVRIGHLSFWAMAMYVAAYPFILSERASSNALEDEGEGIKKYQGQVKGVIGRDLLWLYLTVVIINWAESYYIDTKLGSDLFLRVAFEVSSAFGNVGLSLGLPQKPKISFCGNFVSPISKIMIILTMYCGKLRGLPPSVDKSIDIYEDEPDSDEEVEGSATGSSSALGQSFMHDPAGSPNSLGDEEEMKHATFEKEGKENKLLDEKTLPLLKNSE